MTAELFAKVDSWIADDPDENTREQAAEVLLAAREGDAQSIAQLEQWFGPFLTFGTAGLRGPLGPGPSCMNRAVVSRAAAGLCAYLVKRNAKKIVVGYDARHGSIDFALDTVAIAAGAGLEAILLPRTLPTPVLAFAIRHLGCDAGVMVTASHNPAQDNGYKVYLGDGSQIVPPADSDIAAEISAVTSVASLQLSDEWETADEEVVTAYINSAVAVVAPSAPRALTVASTSLHGVGDEVWRAVMSAAGFAAPHVVVEQADPDPDFPTVVFPNPEEAGATDLLLEVAKKAKADIAIAHDPDADRCAMAAPMRDGSWRLLRGDEVGALLGWWTLARASEFKLATPQGTFANSIVSSTLLGKMAAKNNMPFQFTLTGFKWIAKIEDLLFGFEEALGYCVDPASVRDKDGISAGLRLVEMAAHLKANNRTVNDVLDDIAREFGLHRTDQLSVRMSDLAAIPAAVARLRATPPATVAGMTVLEVIDLKNGWSGLPPTDGIMLQLEGGRVIARPSGTEPKLKCYLECIIDNTSDIAAAEKAANDIIAKMKSDMALALGV
jgi:phosphomannomutase